MLFNIKSLKVADKNKDYKCTLHLFNDLLYIGLYCLTSVTLHKGQEDIDADFVMTFNKHFVCILQIALYYSRKIIVYVYYH